MSENIESKVIKIVSETLKQEERSVSFNSSFVDDLGADSLDQVELMMAIEEEFDLEIPDEDATKISTVADVVKYIEERTEAKI